MATRIRDAGPPRWDLFCRVVDNLGDAAVCWRLARQLAREHGQAVRLWIDVPAPLGLLRPGAMAGAEVDGVRIEAWRDDDPRLADGDPGEVADVVIGAFACALPSAYRAAMRERGPVWIDLEYLSAEDWVASCHGLPSPKPDGLVEHFFFPGFGPGTGGLLRESDLLSRRAAFDADPDARRRTLSALGVALSPDVRLASLFCYPDASAAALLDALAARGEAWRVLVPRGIAPDAAGHPIAVDVPFVPQADYDELLWCCELNFVRGEDSLVRALWAGRPLVWQAYPQAEDTHLLKVRAWLNAWSRDGLPTAPAAAALAAMHEAWNLRGGAATDRIAAAVEALADALPSLRTSAVRWTLAEGERPDLATRLLEFVRSRL